MPKHARKPPHQRQGVYHVGEKWRSNKGKNSLGRIWRILKSLSRQKNSNETFLSIESLQKILTLAHRVMFIPKFSKERTPRCNCLRGWKHRWRCSSRKESTKTLPNPKRCMQG